MKQRVMAALRALVLLLVLVPMLGSCQAKDETVMLGIEGYNYTDRYIDRFSVGGQGGGNVSRSQGDSGGGGTYCCIGYNPKRPLPIKMLVEWTFGYEMDDEGSITLPDQHHKATAVLDGPVPADPRFLEVHFMPDGTVRLLVTAERSYPLIQVDRTKAAAELGAP